jgi:hypothetical protein
MAAVGVPWERMVVTKLETGRRPNVSVEEMLALAYVLDVAPVHLLVPIDDADETRYRIVPAGPSIRLETARAWIRGFQPIKVGPHGIVDARNYFSEVPASEYPTVPRFSQPTDDSASDTPDPQQGGGGGGER